MESRRYGGGKVAHRHVLYLGELNDSQREAWQRTLEVVDERTGESRQMALFPADRAAPATPAQIEALQVRLERLRPLAPAAVGRVLAGRPALAPPAPRHLLRRAYGPKPRGHRLGKSPARARALPAHLARLGVAAASPLVRLHRVARFARGGREYRPR